MLGKVTQIAKGIAIGHAKTTATLATSTMPIPKKIIVPMQQHIGAPATPVVKKGDQVYVGTVIGAAAGVVSAHIHSSVSGTVTGMEQLLAPTGKIVDAVVIEADGEQTVDPAIKPPVVRDRESFLEAVAACGLVGLGGAGFPVAVKLNPPQLDKIETLIINAAECEPFLTSDDREMMECGDTVLSGLLAVQKYLDIKRVIIGIERNKPDAMNLMFSLTKGDATLKVHPLNARYPQGAEKVLIEATTQREVPPGKLPSDVGVIVMNVTTVSTIGKYLISGMPLLSKRLTVDGGAIVEPKNVDVLIGTPISDVIEFCGGYKFPPKKLIMGGPMMGVAMENAEYPVIKQNNGILAFSEHEVATSEPLTCIRCGRCVNACPMGLCPVEIGEAYEKRDIDAMKRLWAINCIACGSCSYVCPSKRLVSPTAVLARNLSMKEARKNAGK